MYSLIQSLFDPFLVAYVLIFAVAAELCFRRRLSRARLLVLATSVLALGIVTTPVFAYIAVGTLEWRFPPRAIKLPDPGVIVVLSGRVHSPDEVRSQPELGVSTLYRCLRATELYRQLGSSKIVLSGGRVPEDCGYALADVMYSFMLTQGVPDADLIIEDRSTTTYENAVEVRNRLKGSSIQSVILVTDATHLLRAKACFAAQGFEVVPVGCRYRATAFRWGVRSFLPNSESATATAEATHEWVGLGWYWFCGRI